MGLNIARATSLFLNSLITGYRRLVAEVIVGYGML